MEGMLAARFDEIKLIVARRAEGGAGAGGGGVGGSGKLRLEDITLDEGAPLGRGAHGEVWGGKLALVGAVVDVAVKIARVGDKGAVAAIRKELEVLGALRHKRLLHLFGWAENFAKNEMWAVLELCELGNVEQILKLFTDDSVAHSPVFRVLGVTNIYDARYALSVRLGSMLPGAGKAFFRIARDTTSALGYLHDEKLVHLDIKTSNILVDVNGRCRVSDFGVVHKLRGTIGGPRETQSGARGTVGYMAVELLGNDGDERRRPEADTFSVAVLFNVLLCGDEPFPTFQDSQIIAAYMNGKRPELPKSPSGQTAQLVALIKSMWAGNPKDRPSMKEVEVELKRIEESRSTILGDGGGAGTISHRMSIEATKILSVAKIQEAIEAVKKAKNLPLKKKLNEILKAQQDLDAAWDQDDDDEILRCEGVLRALNPASYGLSPPPGADDDLQASHSLFTFPVNRR